MKVEPEGKSLTIKVDSIRAITKKTSETAQQGGNKVIHIEAAQKMNVNAANALLKVLEEPTDNTFILLESDQLSQTLPTVRSRCRIVQLKQPSTEQALEYLKTKEMSVNEQAALSIASARPLDALKVDQEMIDKWYAREEKFLSNHQFTELSQYIAKENIEEVLSQVLLWLDSVLRYKLNAKLELAPVSEGLLKSLANCENVPLFHLRDYIVEKLAGQKRQSNLNSQLMAEELTSRWLKLRGQQ
jgi:DNA polymerase-3 subunit delta'